MKITLSLKRRFFEMIASGEKKEEYRVPKPYWIKRLALEYEERLYGPPRVSCKKFDTVVFTLGYPTKTDNSRRMEFRVKRLRYGFGETKWGAEKNHEYFVFELGDRIK